MTAAAAMRRVPEFGVNFLADARSARVVQTASGLSLKMPNAQLCLQISLPPSFLYVEGSANREIFCSCKCSRGSDQDSFSFH